MLQVLEMWLIAKNLKSLEKGNEHLLYIYYMQALDWAIDVEHVHWPSKWLYKVDAFFFFLLVYT